ncbi:disulfide bond formation protein DsbB [Endozoicomonas montiporae]|uniref:Disulfide bond formation protein B n=2 Tax=Endozoicomonas montiporae TaxID=1027273 RepID=A0A081MZN2_9GAMM|nr:disulfide bond formation protein B [Endozoicomonas montiporae]AMO54657.1 disulfide bond formation protein B [Endozoicomonas montiporae CL-33]KEQ11655.1 disulfide bond formation protein DsbB [Endozoicomonas montiporae]
MTMPRSRLIFFLVAATSAALMVFSFYLQSALNLEPCPLCISQRIAMAGLGTVAILAVLHNPVNNGYRCYGGFLALMGMAGALLASRQLWMQSLPPEEVPACMPSIEYLVDILPFTEILKIMLTGSGDCADVQWAFLGLSIPGWTLIVFTGMLIVGLFECLRKREARI